MTFSKLADILFGSPSDTQTVRTDNRVCNLEALEVEIHLVLQKVHSVLIQ